MGNSIVICAGHHQDRQGAINKKHNTTEYREAVVIQEFMVDILKSLGVKVYIFNGKLSDKVEYINSIKPSLALDLHFNADADHLDPEDLDDDRGFGCMVMYCPQKNNYGVPETHSYSRKSQAQRMSDGLSKWLKTKNLGARQGWYWGSNPPSKKDYFLRKTSCPAFIPEFGYIDNNRFCETWLISNRHAELAEALSKEVIIFLRGV